MKRKIKQMTAIILMTVLVLTLCISTGFAADKELPTENTYRDIVLVLDCSGSMPNTDPYELCATACKLLVDQIPLDNTRMAIISYGYNGGTAYSMHNYKINNTSELNLVNVVTPLQETAAVKNIEGLKAKIDEVTNKNGGTTPTGTALLSAVDLLEQSGSTDGNACIVLLTDGECTTRSTVSYDKDNVDTAVKSAFGHEWPIFAMQMNSNNRFGENSDQTKRMKHIAIDSGTIADGYKNEDYCYFNLVDFNEGNIQVSIAASHIFAWVANNFPPPEPENYELPADIEYDVPNLASEFNITLLGSSLKDVSITYPDGSKKSITGNITNDKYILTSVVEGSYYNIKLFCPVEGTYIVHADADGSNKVAISLDVSTMDMNLSMDTDPVLSSAGEDVCTLSKDTTVRVGSHFFYRDIDVLNNRYYEEKQPKLVVKGNVSTAELVMTGSAATGYSADLRIGDLSEYGSGFAVYVLLEDPMFPGGCKVSGTRFFKTENLLSEIITPSVEDLKGYINSTVEINLGDYIKNPDGDVQEISLECISDRSKSIDYTYANDKLILETGMQEGVYELQLKVKDHDMPAYLELNPFTLTVENQPFSYEKIKNVEVWIDSYPWQEAGNAEFSLNLADYYSDPDGLDAVFGEIAFDGKDTVYSCTQNGTELHFTPIEKGEGSISFTVSDHVSEQEVTVGVKVVSGKAVFWAENWIWFLIAAIVIAAIVITLLVLSATTRVKGNWSIELQDENGGRIFVEHLNIASNTVAGNKKKVKLAELIDEIVPFAEKTGNLEYNYRSYDGLGEIILNGVTFGSGFTITKIPTKVRAEAGGLPVQGQKRIKIETLRLTFDDPSGMVSRMTLQMRPR